MYLLWLCVEYYFIFLSNSSFLLLFSSFLCLLHLRVYIKFRIRLSLKKIWIVFVVIKCLPSSWKSSYLFALHATQFTRNACRCFVDDQHRMCPMADKEHSWKFNLTDMSNVFVHTLYCCRMPFALLWENTHYIFISMSIKMSRVVHWTS